LFRLSIHFRPLHIGLGPRTGRHVHWVSAKHSLILSCATNAHVVQGKTKAHYTIESSIWGSGILAQDTREGHPRVRSRATQHLSVATTLRMNRLVFHACLLLPPRPPGGSWSLEPGVLEQAGGWGHMAASRISEHSYSCICRSHHAAPHTRRDTASGWPASYPPPPQAHIPMPSSKQQGQAGQGRRRAPPPPPSERPGPPGPAVGPGAGGVPWSSPGTGTLRLPLPGRRPGRS
jgi:hypothetical protein